MSEHSWDIVTNTWIEQLIVIIIFSIVYYVRTKTLDESNYKEYSAIYISTCIAIILDVALWTYNIDLKYLSYQVDVNSNPNGEMVTVFHFISIIGAIKLMFYKDKDIKGK